MSWRLAGGPPAPTPAEALAASPAVGWPVRLVADDGRVATLGEALGPGGNRVDRLLGPWCRRPTLAPGRLKALVAATPAGPVDLPVEVVALDGAVEASADVDRGWLATVEGIREEPAPSCWPPAAPWSWRPRSTRPCCWGPST